MVKRIHNFLILYIHDKEALVLSERLEWINRQAVSPTPGAGLDIEISPGCSSFDQLHYSTHKRQNSHASSLIRALRRSPMFEAKS